MGYGLGLYPNINRPRRPGYGELSAPTFNTSLQVGGDSNYGAPALHEHGYGYSSGPNPDYLPPGYRAPSPAYTDQMNRVGEASQDRQVRQQNFYNSVQRNNSAAAAGTAARSQAMMNPGAQYGGPQFFPSTKVAQGAGGIPSSTYLPDASSPAMQPYTEAPQFHQGISIPMSMTGTPGHEPTMMQPTGGGADAVNHQSYLMQSPNGGRQPYVPLAPGQNMAVQGPVVNTPGYMTGGTAGGNTAPFNGVVAPAGPGKQVMQYQDTPYAVNANRAAYQAEVAARAATPYEQEQGRANALTGAYVSQAQNNVNDTRSLQAENVNLRNQLARYQTSGGGENAQTKNDLAQQRLDLAGKHEQGVQDRAGTAETRRNTQFTAKQAQAQAERSVSIAKVYQAMPKAVQAELGDPIMAQTDILDDKGQLVGHKGDIIGYSNYRGIDPVTAHRKAEDKIYGSVEGAMGGQGSSVPTMQQSGGSRPFPTRQQASQAMQHAGSKEAAMKELQDQGFDVSGKYAD